MSNTNAKNLDDLFTEVRALINDTVSPYRWADALILAYLNTALRELYRYRPDAFIGNFTSGVLSANLIPTYVTGDLGTSAALPVDDRLFFGPLVFYVAGRTELTDDEFADNNRAMTLLGNFRNMLIGPGG